MSSSFDPSRALRRIALPNTTVEQLFRRARSAIVLTDPQAPDNPIVACNAAFLDLTGYAEHEVIGHNCRFLQGPDTSRQDIARISKSLAARQTGQFELLNYRKDGSRFWNSLHMGPIFDDDGTLQYFFGSQFDVTQVVEERLVHAQEHLQLTHALRAAGAVGTFDWDVARDSIAVDEGFARAFDLDPAKAAAGLPIGDFYAHVDPADVDGLRRAVDDAVRTGAYFEHEYGVQGDDRHRWLLGRGQCLYDAEGRPTRFSGVVVDITGRKEKEEELRGALEHASILRSEIDHRIKNLFAIVPAIVNLSARDATDVKTFVRDVQDRIGALSRAHSLTVDMSDADHGVELHALARAVLDPYMDDRMPFGIEGPDVRIAQREASPVALALHEFATNAAKYGALLAPEGHVAIVWTLAPGPADPQPPGTARQVLSLRWRESGGRRIPGPPARQGSGSRMIDTLAASMSGRVERHWHPDGLEIRLEVPLV